MPTPLHCCYFTTMMFTLIPSSWLSIIMDDFVITGLVGTPEQIADIITVRLTSHVSAQVKNYATQEIKALANEVKRRVQEEVNEKVNEKINDTVKDKLGDKVKGLKFKLGNN